MTQEEKWEAGLLLFEAFSITVFLVLIIISLVKSKSNPNE